MLMVRMVAYTAVRLMDDGDERIDGGRFFFNTFLSFHFFFAFSKGETRGRTDIGGMESISMHLKIQRDGPSFFFFL